MTSNKEAPAVSYADQAPINYSTSQAATSYAGSVVGAKKQYAPSTASAYTSSTVLSEGDRLVRREGGRDFNILNDTYSLPADADEWGRLDTQHRAFCLGLGGLYPAPEVVRSILAPEEGVTKRIVDLGCGTGVWATEMAREFPHCEVLGVDLAPVPLLPENLPENCHFEMDDVNLGLEHLRGQYDVVFARAIAMGLKNFRQALADVILCAKPGGIVIWMDGDYDFYSGWPMTCPPYFSSANPNGSYSRRVLYEVRRCASLGESDVMTMESLIDEGFWNNAPMLDPDTCKAASVYLPIGTWCKEGDAAQQEKLKYVGMLLRQDFTEASRTTQPPILKAGWSRQTNDQWAAGMREECQNGTIGLRMRLAWGRRRAGPNLPAPELRAIPEDEERKEAVKYPFYEVYDTPEEAAAATEKRNRDKNIPPPPLPWEGIE